MAGGAPALQQVFASCLRNIIAKTETSGSTSFEIPPHASIFKSVSRYVSALPSPIDELNAAADLFNGGIHFSRVNCESNETQSQGANFHLVSNVIGTVVDHSRPGSDFQCRRALVEARSRRSLPVDCTVCTSRTSPLASKRRWKRPVCAALS